MLCTIVPDELYLEFTETGLRLNLPSHHGDALVVSIEGALFNELMHALLAAYGFHPQDGEEGVAVEADQESLPF